MCYQKNGICIDSIDCSESNNDYILDEEGNKCSNVCDNGKILLSKENFCSVSCDESIYILNDNNECVLCKDY
jgi:hypothetical protein